MAVETWGHCFAYKIDEIHAVIFHWSKTISEKYLQNATNKKWGPAFLNNNNNNVKMMLGFYTIN